MFDEKEIIAYIKNRSSATFLDIVREMNIKAQYNKEFSLYLNNLKSKGKISFDKRKNTFYIPKFIGNFEAKYKISIKGHGFCFVEFENQTIKVSLIFNKFNLFKDDTISVNVFSELNDGYYFGIVEKIIERKNKFLYAEIDDKLNLKLISFDENIKLIYDKKNLIPNSYASFKILEYLKDAIKIKFEKTISLVNQPYSDIELLIEMSNVNKEFSSELLKEANDIPSEVENVTDYNRVDLSDKLIVTIDGEKTKDFDDAISIEKTKNGNYILGVHIADVAYYVKENSLIDLEARKRGNSIYLIDKVIPMLPEKLSNIICSLNPNVKRFTLTLESEIDLNGKIIWHKIYPSMIESKFRLTYNQVANIENDETIKNNKLLFNMLKIAYELSDILSKKKYDQGYIDFEIEEPIIELDKQTGKVISITNKKRLSSEILIENFMVFANEVVSKTIADLNIPSIYRVHDAPDVEKFESLKSFIKVIGINNVTIHSSIKPKVFQVSIEEIKKRRFDNLVKMALLRTMQKAKYSTKNIGHFGLASDYYSHFTSPIRRYPDLLLHRIIWEAIIKNNKKYSIDSVANISQIAEHSSQTEIKATELERKVNDVKKAEYYENKINQVIQGTIVSIHKFGIFVEFDDMTNSLVHISTLVSDNNYVISNDMCNLKTKNKNYSIGQKVNVKIIKISKLDGKIDSILV